MSDGTDLKAPVRMQPNLLDDDRDLGGQLKTRH
jgi:hypothetical protein